MTLGMIELARAREGTQAILDALGLSGYLFEVEPSDKGWRVRVECDTGDGWAMVTLDVDADSLGASRNDDAARDALVETWRPRFEHCIPR
ncbi:MAG: hypothetical protein AB1344_00465 [Pseudomonadota bacterium]